MKNTSFALWFATCMLLMGFSASARVIHVGPNENIQTVAQAARIARDDDVVEIAPGEYKGDVTIWTQKRLTIRGVGQRPVLIADGKAAEDKAIWVIRNGDFSITNIEFRGARVADGNGAGIRFERGRLSVAQCAFLDNENGILTANYADAELIIDQSIFANAPQHKSPLPHLLYVGRIALLRVTGSRFHNGYYGHLLKSRARVSDIRYNLLVDGEGGSASYEADFPNGGDVTLVGNVLGQSSSTQNPTIVAYGAEGNVWSRNRLRMVHNTLYSQGAHLAVFLRVFADRLNKPVEVVTHNNLLAGVGIFTANVDGQHRGNFFVPTAVLGNPDMLDFTLGQNSWLRGMVTPVTSGPDNLQPQFEHLVPGHISVIRALSKWAPGAVQASTLERP